MRDTLLQTGTGPAMIQVDDTVCHNFRIDNTDISNTIYLIFIYTLAIAILRILRILRIRVILYIQYLKVWRIRKIEHIPG